MKRCFALPIAMLACLTLAIALFPSNAAAHQAPAASGSVTTQGPPLFEQEEGFVTTPGGARIHYVSTATSVRVGTCGAHCMYHIMPMNLPPNLLFIPGWTMPAWIWEKQLEHFSSWRRAVAIDPRSQGESSKETEGHYPAARARDIKAVIDHLKLAPVVLVGWSMGVTEIAAYVDQFGTQGLAGVVLVDGIAGGDFDPNVTPRMYQFAASFQIDRPKTTAAFVRSMFRKPQTGEYLQRLTDASLATPTNSAVALFLGTFTADYRPALGKIDKPTLILAAGDDKTNPWMAKYRDMQQRIPGARLEQFPDCGHALFLDDPARFNSLLAQFLSTLDVR